MLTYKRTREGSPVPDCCFLWQHRGRDKWGERRRGGMLFYAQYRSRLTALAITSMVSATAATPTQKLWDLLMDQYGDRPRNPLTAHNVVTVFFRQPRNGGWNGIQGLMARYK